MRSLLFLMFGLLLCASVRSSSVYDTLYINRGNFVTVDQSTFPALSYNDSETFNANSVVIRLGTTDTVQIVLINTDTTAHGFRVDALNQETIVAAGDTGSISLHSPNPGAYIYYDPLNTQSNAPLGLTGILAVDNGNVKDYYWNIREHQNSFNELLAVNQPVDWSQYAPNYFTINGKSFTDLQSDTTAVVNASVGDTVRIFLANTGRSKHSIHFHGFHTKSVYNDAGMVTGASKDTWAVKSMQALVLEFVPDKPGQYSVHDHNLVAVTGGGTHPNGMFLIMTILP